MKRSSPEEDLLIREAIKITQALGRMFAPLCEVVLHDLRRPERSIVAIENPLSGRKPGDATTNIGLARAQDPKFPDVLQNYPNTLPDGRVLKSTSIGLRNSKGEYIAALCLNFDVTPFADFTSVVAPLIANMAQPVPVQEKLKSLTVSELERTIREFSSQRKTTPRHLSLADKRLLLRQLSEEGLLSLKNAIPTVANILGVTRASVYNYQKKANGDLS